MKGTTKKVIVFVVTMAFLWTSYSFVTLHSNSSMSTMKDESGNLSPIAFSSSSYSVHLYVNGNGYVKFSANYSLSGIDFSFDNDKSQNFTTNDVPSGTVFHLVSSPNAGYQFVNWTGSVDSTNNSIYVTVNQNIQEEAIYVKSPSYPVSLAESGLPSGTEWYLNLSNGQSFSSVTSTISLNETNGSYSYTIATSDKDYSPSPSSGSFTVNGASVPVSVTFSPVLYKVTFTETGLPSGTTWYVNITGQLSSGAITGTSYSLSLTNGTYSYTIGTTNKEYSAPGGSFTVNGSPITEPVKFSEVTYSVTFTETGLPSGTTWYVNLTGFNGTNMNSGQITGTTYSVNLPNGTYTFTIATSDKIYSPSPPSGSFTVNGSTVSKSATFSKVTYKVTFTESGLPSGTEWYLNLSNGQSFSSVTSTISLNETNGSYSYTIATSDKEYSSPGGSFTVNGASVSKSATFSKVTYEVTFTESGLPSGTTWYVNLTGFNGTKIESGPITVSSYSFSLINGTYSYTIQTVNKIYEPSVSSGSFTVNGSPITEPVKFSEVTYSVTFTETGLPSGTEWYVNVTNSTGYVFHENSTSATISFSLVNGTYTFTNESSNKIYEPSSTGGSFTVDGEPLSLKTVTFTEVTYTVTFTESGLPSGTEWYLNLSNGQSFSSVTSTISLNETNGSYSYTIATSDKEYSSPGGSFTVNGASVSKSATFSKVTYKVTFTESGLPSGTEWYLNLSNGQSFSSVTSTISLNETNGSYSYTIATSDKDYSPSPSSGSFTVNGASVPVSVTFSPVLYKVTFTETGLPSGTTWYVNLTGFNGTNMNSGQITGTTYSVNLPNGTYTFTIATSDKIYSPSPPSGSFTVNGSTVSKSATFSKVTYKVTFTESGLPTGITWYVNETTASYHAISPADISFMLSNGTYTFTVTNLTSYYTTTPLFSFTVNGNNVTETVHYYHWAYITGTMSPGNATLMINGIAVSVSSGHFNVSVANGSYHVVASESGYSTYYNNFTLNAGSLKNLTIDLTPVSKPSTTTPRPSSISSTEIYVIVGVVAAVAVVAGAVLLMRKKK